MGVGAAAVAPGHVSIEMAAAAAVAADESYDMESGGVQQQQQQTQQQQFGGDWDGRQLQQPQQPGLMRG